MLKEEEVKISEKPIYSCVDYWSIMVYPGLFQSEKIVEEKIEKYVEETLTKLSSKFTKDKLKEIEGKVEGEFKNYKVEPDFDRGFLPLPFLEYSFNGSNANARIRINPCLTPKTHTKITTIMELEEDVTFRTINRFVPNAKERGREITKSVAKSYKELASEYKVKVDERVPSYRVYLTSIGMNDAKARDIILLSKESKKLIEAAKSDEEIWNVLEDIGKYETINYETEAEQWRIKKIFTPRGNADIDGRKAIVGAYGLYKFSAETDFLVFTFGDHDRVHEVTKEIVLDFISDL